MNLGVDITYTVYNINKDIIRQMENKDICIQDSFLAVLVAY